MLSRAAVTGFHRTARTLATVEITVREALNTALAEEMERDDRVFVIGEEVAEYNGAYKITKGLFERFGGDRVVDTPITEAGFAGLATGSAFAGLRPVCEFMTFNFSMQAMDHLVNSAAKSHYMSAGRIEVPIVFRGPNGAAAAVAAQHSQCFAAWYSSVPGLEVIAPYDAEDARGLLKAAIRSQNPVVFLENEIMYGQTFAVEESVVDKDFLLEIGKAKIMVEGSDLSFITFGKSVGLCMEASEELKKEGISAEVLNLRTLRPIDRQAVFQTAMKTGRVVAVEEGWHHCGICSEIIAMIAESHAFDYLDSHMERVTGADVPMPYAQGLEQSALPVLEDVLAAARRVTQRNL